MSTWMTTNMKCKCSVNVLVDILVGQGDVMQHWKSMIGSEWRKHLVIDPSGETLVNGRKCKVVLKGSWRSIGFAQDDDGNWTMIADSDYMKTKGGLNIPNVVKTKIKERNLKALAAKLGATPKITKAGNKVIITLEVPDEAMGSVKGKILN